MWPLGSVFEPCATLRQHPCGTSSVKRGVGDSLGDAVGGSVGVAVGVATGAHRRTKIQVGSKLFRVFMSALQAKVTRTLLVSSES